MAKKKHEIRIDVLDPSITTEQLVKLEEEGPDFIESPLIKSIVNTLARSGDTITRLAFEEDPQSPNRIDGLYYNKVSLVPDPILKRIAATDDLVAAIVQTRGNQISAFGNPLEDRHDTGFRIEPKHGVIDKLSEEQKEDLKIKIKAATIKLANCGSNLHWSDEKKITLATFLYQSARNAAIFGRFATEIIWVEDPVTRLNQFHSFRATDPGTIYRLLPKSAEADMIRRQAFQKLKEITKKDLIPETESHEYSWIQVINGVPQNVFTAQEMIVYNCYPVTDVELNGYPLTPIDTAVSAITTHINITNFNKLYFQNGRASRGMLVIASDDVDPSTLQDLKQQFNAVINGVQNAFRMPLIRVGPDDKVDWKPIDTMSRDAEFQFLYDSVSRVILAAFQMSPDELCGYQHLSKPTSGSTLSESSNEWKLESAKDAGIRPLVAHFQEFLNHKILPLIDEEVAAICNVKLYGIDSETEEEETKRLMDMIPQFGTYDEAMTRLEKLPIGKAWGGLFPMNALVQQMFDKYFTVGQIKEHFFGHEGASKDPRWNYVRDPFYFQNIQVIQAEQQMKQQQQMAENQLAAQQQAQQGQPQQGQGQQQDELASGIDQLLHKLHKTEPDLALPNRKKLQDHHKEVVNKVMEEWYNESKKELAQIADLVHRNKKK